MTLRFQPKGGMCSICKDRDEDCSHLDFVSMLPVLNSYVVDDENIMNVKCSEFVRLQ